jgi:hypothetical protein
MAEEEKGFVIKDRRSFDEKGERKEKEGEEEKEEKRKPAEEKSQTREEPRTGPLPEVNFSTLIMSLSSSALLNFGEIPDPVTGEKKRDLPLAKHAIDTISMLRGKTQGNLTEDEQKFLDSILTDLKWRYVKASK